MGATPRGGGGSGVSDGFYGSDIRADTVMGLTENETNQTIYKTATTRAPEKHPSLRSVSAGISGDDHKTRDTENNSQ